MRAHAGMLAFRIGDRVTFRPSGRHPIEGVLTRYNRKTVTVVTDDGAQWNVSPEFLSKVLTAQSERPGSNNVIMLDRR